jgi:hypothetical protein
MSRKRQEKQRSEPQSPGTSENSRKIGERRIQETVDRRQNEGRILDP